MSTYGYLMSTYNQASTLEASLDQVLCQHSDHVVVVDDASTDNTCEILNGMRSRGAKFDLHRNSINLGVVDSYNRFIPSVKADYVCLPASDDMLASSHLHELRKGEMYNAGLMFGALRLHRADVIWRVCHKLPTGYYSRWHQVAIARKAKWEINTQTAFIRKDLIGYGYARHHGCLSDWILCQTAAFAGGCYRSRWVLGDAFLGESTWGMRNPPQWKFLLSGNHYEDLFRRSGLVGRMGIAGFSISLLNAAYVRNLLSVEIPRLATKLLPKSAIRLLVNLLT